MSYPVIRKFSGVGSPQGKTAGPAGATYEQQGAPSGNEIWEKALGTDKFGWRVRGTVGPPVANALAALSTSLNTTVMSSPPTLATVGPGGASPINSGAPLAYRYDDTRLTLLGMVPTVYTQFSVDYWLNTVNYGWTASPFAVEFDHYGDDLAIRFRCGAASQSQFWVFVDGQPATSAPQTSSAASGGSLYWYRVTFSSVALRRIRVYCYLADFGGLDIKPTHSASATPHPPTKVLFYGDSWIEGTGATAPMSALALTAGRMLGAETFIAGQGGTGYVATGTSGLSFTDSGRLAAVASAKPDYVILFGSLNDDGASASTVGGYLQTVLTTLAASLPNAQVIVTGPQSYGSGVGSARLLHVVTMKAVAAAAPNCIGFIDPTSDESGSTWITGSGSTTSTAGDGNADVFHNGAAPVHPTQAGHDYYARRMVQEIQRIMLNPARIPAPPVTNTYTIPIAASGDDGIVYQLGSSPGTTFQDWTGPDVEVSNELSGQFIWETGLIRFDTSIIGAGGAPIAAYLLGHLDTAHNADAKALTIEYFDWSASPLAAWNAQSPVTTGPTVALAGMSLGAFTVGQDVSIPLSNIGNINKTGYTYFRLNLAPGVNPNGLNELHFTSYDKATSPNTNRMRLVVTVA